MMGTAAEPGIAPRLMQDILASGASLEVQVLEVYKADVYCLLEYMEKRAAAPRGAKAPELCVACGCARRA